MLRQKRHYRGNTYKSGSLSAVPWLNLQRHVEQVVRKLILTPVSHRVQVLKKPLCNKNNKCFESKICVLHVLKCNKDKMMSTHPDVMLHLQAVRLVLILLDLSGDFRHFPPLAEVDQLLAVAFEEVRVAFLCLQDVG